MKAIAPLAIVVVLLLVLFAQLGREATAQVGLVRRVPWPPLPEDIVVVQRDLNGTTLEPGDQIELYGIPQDKWFVVTGWKVDQAGFLFASSAAPELTEVRVFYGGSGNVSGPGPLGVSCSPGSRLFLRNTSPFTIDYGPDNPLALRGYLVDAGL